MNYSAFDHCSMAMALRLARRGINGTDPNPRVGCVIARDGNIVGRGWHDRAGGPHAEIVALAEAGEAARGASVYVTLEPCSHHGRTPPCAEALIEAGVAEVTMALEDPNPQVNGDGRRALENAGIACRAGLLAEEAETLNRGFLSRMRAGRPWVRVKLAQSLDGRTALGDGASQWISGAGARADVQNWRARSSAVMTGIGTLLADDPSLDVRLPGVARQPMRIVVDSHWRTPASARTLGLEGGVLVAGLAAEAVPAELESSAAGLLGLPAGNGGIDLRALLAELASRDVNEIQVEAGGRLSGSLLAEQLVDEVLLYIAPCLLGEGAMPNFTIGPLAAMDERFEFDWLDVRRVGGDLRLLLKPQYPGD